MFLHKCRDAGQARVVVHHKYWSVGASSPLNFLQCLFSRDGLGLCYRSINYGSLVVPGEKQVLQLHQSLVSRLSTGADPHYPQCQAVRDVLRDVVGVAARGQQVHVPVCLLPVQVDDDLAALDGALGVKERNMF